MLLLVLLSPGCGPFISSPTGSDFNAYEGTDGLFLSFAQLPTSIKAERYFKISVDLQNKGATDITDGVLVMSYPVDYVSLDDPSQRIQQFSLEGKKRPLPMGERDRKSYDFHANNLDLRRDALFHIKGCYSYETHASFRACVDTNIYKEKGSEPTICTEQEANRNAALSGGQGAPVAVTRITQQVTEGKSENSYDITFFITIQDLQKFNSGELALTTPSTLCGTENPRSIQWNTVGVKATLDNEPITCETQELEIIDGTASLECWVEEINIQNQESVDPTLQLTLTYTYAHTISSGTIDV